MKRSLFSIIPDPTLDGGAAKNILDSHLLIKRRFDCLIYSCTVSCTFFGKSHVKLYKSTQNGTHGILEKPVKHKILGALGVFPETGTGACHAGGRGFDPRRSRHKSRG
jgi:hypothetical protein